jgi:hypothetical protein
VTTKHQSWDEFWAEVSAKGRTETIRGVTVPVPTDIPLALEKRAEELHDSTEWDDVAELVEMLFGTKVLDQWQDAGMGLRELQTVFTWGMAQAGGNDLSFREVYEQLQKSDVGKAPKPSAPNRATRRRQSASTGGPSKRISSANTGSAHGTSQR